MFIGIDCGGGKTAAALCNRQGRVLAQVRDIGAAIVGLPDLRFYKVVGRVLARLAEQSGVRLDQVERVALGLSGVDYADEQAQQHELIAARFKLEGRLDLVNDGLVALWGASAAPASALFQHGTGVTTAYRSDFGGEAIFDSLDVAQVFDLRRAAFALTARMIDGRAEPTRLKDRVLVRCGVEPGRFAEWAFRDPNARTVRAAIASVVFEAWRAGDPAAAGLVAQAADDYVLTMRVMGERIGRPFEAAFGGGVIALGGADFQRLLGERLVACAPDARLAPIALPPERGALVLAAHGCGADPSDLFAKLAALEPAS
ncbi:BadF/BadG/BcrA/BcrD ATPase family protein [Phenylobacterium sp.]|uniref:BadF/BadG/BcrA/BcrD ATPase family protein n=1 Tax=Phenylobacterium sp. TaxID=1871053 RepID=UPI0035B11CBE